MIELYVFNQNIDYVYIEKKWTNRENIEEWRASVKKS